MVKGLYLLRSTRLRELAEDSDSSSVRSSESTLNSELESLLRPNAIQLQASSTTPKVTVFPDGSSTDSETTEKERISKWLLTSSKPNSERTSKDSSKSEVTEV